MTDTIAEEGLTPKAGDYLFLTGGIGEENIEETKPLLGEHAVEEKIKRQTSETFDPGTSLRLNSDRDLSLP